MSIDGHKSFFIVNMEGNDQVPAIVEPLFQRDESLLPLLRHDI